MIVRRMRLAAIGVLFLALACGRAAPPAPGPSTTERPDIVSAHVLYRSEPVTGRLTVDAAEDLKLEVVFDFPMDRFSTEGALRESLPAGSSFAWRDARTISLAIPPAEPFALRLEGARSADGRELVWSPLIVQRAEHEVAMYRTSDIVAGHDRPIRSIAVPIRIGRLGFGPDSNVAMVDPAGPMESITLIDLSSGSRETIPLPEGSTWYRFIGWLPDGSLLIAGSELWIAGPRGEDAKRVGSRAGQAIRLSPNGGRIAMWSADTQRMSVVELSTGVTMDIPGQFSSCGGGTVPAFEWSPENSELAVTSECSGPTARLTTTQFVRMDGSVVREISNSKILNWLRSGAVLLARAPTDPAGEVTIVMAEPDGSEKRVPGDSIFLSPDHRFIAYGLDDDAACASVGLFEISTGRSYPVASGYQPAGWTHAGELVLLSTRAD